MTGEGRIQADQYARRVNAAAKLLAEGLDPPEATRRLAHRYGVSDRQAYRYVERARDAGTMEIPGPKKVFTVKVPADLVRRLRSYARTSTRTLSSLVAQAVGEFLARVRAGPAGGG